MKLKKNSMDIALDFLCIVMLLGISAYLLTHWGNVPDEIPMHYDFAGNVTRYGGKSGILFLPALAWLFFIIMTVVEKYPHAWNTGVEITEENKDRIYSLLHHLISSCKFIFVLLFSSITILTVRSLPLPSWFMLLLTAVAFGNVIFWLVKIVKNK